MDRLGLSEPIHIVSGLVSLSAVWFRAPAPLWMPRAQLGPRRRRGGNQILASIKVVTLTALQTTSEAELL